MAIANPSTPDVRGISDDIRMTWNGKAFAALRRGGELAAFFILVIVALEAFIVLAGVEPYIFPAPSAIGRALWRGLIDGSYLSALAVTMTEILGGLALGALLGISLGVAMVNVSLLERFLYPCIVALQTVPKVAIAPLMIIWFGFGLQSKIFMVTVMCLFPCLINTIAGLRATDSDRINLIRAMRGSRWQILRYVQLPSAAPYIMAGINTAVVLAIIGAIVGEFVGAKVGIGVLILKANFELALDVAFSLIVLLAITGVILSTTIKAIERRLCFWSGRATK